MFGCLLPVEGVGEMYPYGSKLGDFEMTCRRRSKQCRTNMFKIPQFKVANALLNRVSVSI